MLLILDLNLNFSSICVLLLPICIRTNYISSTRNASPYKSYKLLFHFYISFLSILMNTIVQNYTVQYMGTSSDVYLYVNSVVHKNTLESEFDLIKM